MNVPEEPKEDKYNWMRQVGMAVTIPSILAAGPLLGFFIGSFLDTKLKSGNVFLFIFLILGFAASVKETINILKRLK